MSLPKQIGRFQVVETLAPSGKFRLYRATDVTAQTQVVLKTITKDTRNPENVDLISLLKREAEAAAPLKHPGIVQVYEYGEDAGLAFLVLEFVEGCVLQPRLRLPISDAASLAVQMLRALEYAHTLRVLHLNLDPSHLILTSKGELKITDFGGPKNGTTTCAHRSPEQISGGAIDQRSDVFSAGSLFYEFLVGTSPFPGPPEEFPDQIRHTVETPVSHAKPGVPSAFDRVSAKSLAKLPGDRYASAGEFTHDLCAAYKQAYGRAPNEAVSNETAVSAFLSSLRIDSRKSRSRQSVAPPAPKVTSAPPTSTFPPDVLRKVERELAPFLGPLARIVVKEAMPKATDLDSLYELAAESLANPDERDNFLARRPSGRPAQPEDKASSEIAATETATYIELSPVPKSRTPKPGASSGNTFVEGLPPGQKQPSSHDKPSVLSPPRPPIAPDPPLQDRSANSRPESPATIAGPGNAELKSGIEVHLEDLLGKQPANLAGYLAESPPPLEPVIYAFVSSVDALARLHDAGGKTNGLTPQKIAFDKIGKASIERTSTPIRKTTVGEMVGSPRYAAPEVLAEQGAGILSPAAADMYALGFMFYEILMGRKLFQSIFPQKTDLDWLRWHADRSRKAPSLKSRLPDYPTPLSELLEAMTDKDIAKREKDPVSVLSRLKAIQHQASRTIMMSRPAKAPVSGSAGLGLPKEETFLRKRENGTPRTLIVVAAIVLLCALIVIVMGMRRRAKSSPREPAPTGSYRVAPSGHHALIDVPQNTRPEGASSEIA